MLIRLRDFKGVAPRKSPRLLNLTEAQDATMADLRSGEIRAFNGLFEVENPTKAGDITGIYYFVPDGSINELSSTITNITQANPAVVTSAAHGLSNGRRVYINFVAGMTEVNQITFTVANVTTDTFELSGIDSSAYTAYTSAGSWFSGQGYWWHWNSTEASQGVDVAPGPISGDTSKITVYSGHGVPKLALNASAITGGTDYPVTTYDLGVPAPASGTTVAATGTGSGTAVTYFWLLTYVQTYGAVQMEGGPSAVTAGLALQPGEGCYLDNIPIDPGGSANYTHKNLYRLVEGKYRFVAQLDIADTAYADAMGTTGDEIITTDWSTPAIGLIGMTAGPNGMVAAFAEKEVWLCEPYQVHAWPYKKIFPEEIIGIAWEGQSLLVFCKSRPYILTGPSPSAMSQRETAVFDSCVSKPSITNTGTMGVVWASSDGLMSQRGNVIDSWMSRKEWRALSPSSIHGYHWDGGYMFFYDNGTTQGGYYFNQETFGLVPLDFYADSGYRDPQSGQLHLVTSNTIKRWHASSTASAYTWRSRRFKTGREMCFTAARVMAASNASLTFKWYSGGRGRKISGVTQANPAVVTSTAHGAENGDVIYISDVVGMTSLNGLAYTVANVTTDTFELAGVDSTAATAYASGGIWTQRKDTLRHTETVRSDKTFRMPGGYLDEEFFLEVAGTDSIEEILVAETPAELDQEPELS